MSFADLSPDVILDVLSILDFPTVPVPSSSNPAKLPEEPDFDAFYKFHEVSGPWNDALLRLKYRDIKKTLYDQVKVDFHSGELLLFPSQDFKRYQHAYCPVFFDEDLSRIQKLRTHTIAIDGDEEEELSKTRSSTTTDLNALASLFSKPQELTVKNLTKAHSLEMRFLALLSHDFTDIRIENVRGQGKALKKFLSHALHSSKLRYFRLSKCDTYKALAEDILEHVKSDSCRYVLLEQPRIKFGFDFYEKLLNWWQSEGAGKQRLVKFALSRSDGKRMQEMVGGQNISCYRSHDRCSKSAMYIGIENCQNVRVEMKVFNKDVKVSNKGI
uniref:F-box domain-containing protein n=1 Tax=Steinernema glaseri TaxID=37863 RepID=A0A1I7ZKM3_9BILA